MAEVEGEDLSVATVNHLREQRRNMVQADSQYLFIYQVLRKLWQDRYGLVEDEPAAKRLEVDPFVEEDDYASSPPPSTAARRAIVRA